MSQPLPTVHTAASLAGQHAVVTGGGRGIGAGVARALAAQGARLTLIGRTTATLEEAGTAMAADHGVEVGWHSADVTDATSVAGALAAAAEKLGCAHDPGE